MRYLYLLPFVVVFISCEKDDESNPDVNPVTAPATYSFDRSGTTTVFFDGQTERLAMGGELNSALLDFNKSLTDLQEMFANEDANGGDVDPFTNAVLNTSSKSIRSKTAASSLYFSTNSAESAAIKSDFDGWINSQVTEIFPNQGQTASAGVPGQIADGSSARYVSAMGVEYNQAIIKGLIGAFTADQLMNNYLDTTVLDGGNNRDDNNAETLASGKNYTVMEHKWDEAYGYLFGGAQDKENPMNTLGSDDVLLNKYLKKVNGDSDFAGIADDIFNAFKLGRAAIVAKNYNIRDNQAAIIRNKVSMLIAIRAVYYLQAGKIALANGDYGGAFHDLSEGYGFVYSLRFTHNTDNNRPYFSLSEVDDMLGQNGLMGDGPNGFWDLQSNTLDQISQQIADRFPFTVAQAAP